MSRYKNSGTASAPTLPQSARAPSQPYLPVTRENGPKELEIKIELNNHANLYVIKDAEKDIPETRAHQIHSWSGSAPSNTSGLKTLLGQFVRSSQVAAVESIKEGVTVQYSRAVSKRPEKVTLETFLKLVLGSAGVFGISTTTPDQAPSGQTRFENLWKVFETELTENLLVLTLQTKNLLKSTLEELFNSQIANAPKFPDLPVIGPNTQTDVDNLVKKLRDKLPLGSEYDFTHEPSKLAFRLLSDQTSPRSEAYKTALQTLLSAISTKDEQAKRGQKKQNTATTTTDAVSMAISNFLFACSVEEFTDKIPKLSEASQEEIVKKLSYLLEIDSIQIKNKDHLNYAQKHPSLEKFESKFFSEDDFKTKILTQTDSTGKKTSTFLSAAQFQIIKDFEEMLLEIANHPQASQRKRRKPLAMLDTGEGKTFIADLIQKYGFQIGGANNDPSATPNLKQLATRFSGIVQVNLANKHVLNDVGQDLSGKIYLIDEDFFIDDISKKLKSLVTKGAKVLRFGASQNPLMQKANEVRQELKKLAGSRDQDSKIDGSQKNRQSILERREAVKEKLREATFTQTERVDLADWQTLPWKTGNKTQQSKIAQYLISGLQFGVANEVRLETFARTANVDVAVINFVADDKHACLVCRKLDNGSFVFQKYWLQEDGVAAGEFKSSQEFKVFSETIARSNKKIATIYAGNPEFIVGGDYGAISVLGQNCSQEIILPNGNGLDLIKQMVGRNRQTDKAEIAKVDLSVFGESEDYGNFLGTAQKQTNEKDLEELSRNLELKLRGDLGLPNGSIPEPSDEDYKKLISGRYFAEFTVGGFKISPIEIGIDPKALALTRDLRNYLFFDKILNRDFSVNDRELGEQILLHSQALEALKRLGFKTGDTDFRAKMVKSLSGLVENYKADPSLLLNVPNFLTLTADEIGEVNKKEAELQARNREARDQSAKKRKNDEGLQIAALQDQLSSLTEENRKLEESLERKTAEAKEAQDLIEKANQEADSAKNEVTRIRSELEGAKAAGENVTQLDAQLANALAAKKKADEELQEAKTEKEALEAALTKELESSGIALAKVGVLKEELKTVQDAASSSNQEADSAKNEVARIAKELARIEEERKKSVTELEKAAAEKEAAAEELIKAKNQEEALKVEVGHLQQELKAAKENVSSNTELSQGLERLKSDFEKAKKDLVAQQKLVTDAKTKLNKIPKLERDLESAKKRKQELEETLDSASKERPISWNKLKDGAGFEAVKDERKIKLVPSAKVKNPMALALINPTNAKQGERGQKFRYSTKVYKTDQEVKDAIKTIFIKCSDEAGLSLEEAVDAVRKAKEAKVDGLGDYAKNLKESDKPLYKKLRKFSLYFQESAELVCIYSGEEKDKMREDKLVGLRAIFVEEDILAELSGPSKKMSAEQAAEKWREKVGVAQEKLNKNSNSRSRGG